MSNCKSITRLISYTFINETHPMISEKNRSKYIHKTFMWTDRVVKAEILSSYLLWGTGKLPRVFLISDSLNQPPIPEKLTGRPKLEGGLNYPDPSLHYLWWLNNKTQILYQFIKGRVWAKLLTLNQISSKTRIPVENVNLSNTWCKECVHSLNR